MTQNLHIGIQLTYPIILSGSSHCLHILSVNWYCLDNIYSFSLWSNLLNVTYIICPEKAIDEMLCLWRWSPNTFTWFTAITILFTLFIITIFVSFSHTWDRTSTLGDNVPVKALWINRVITFKLWLILAEEACKYHIFNFTFWINITSQLLHQ